MTRSGVVRRELGIRRDEQHAPEATEHAAGTLRDVAQRSTPRAPRRHAFGWARVMPWRGRDDVAHLVLAEGTGPERSDVDDCVARLRRAGYAAAVTSALTAADSLPFVDAGFEVRERLHLLEHRLDDIPAPLGTELPLRRAWRADRTSVLAVDRLAFDGFWRLDDEALRDALHATPAVRFRVGDRKGNGIATAYAITGRAGHRGYLQRVAVHPDARRAGWGRALVLDALRWLQRHDTRRALVNTQWENAAALGLYESCGFRQLPVGLCVLDRAL
jgi:GNAT superfamily N-acetyltransferase